ncbi:pyrroline-5-carboxylate reductase [Nonomuraea guangzhouensis]|uniref:Pyrroline-5-carboxylate reductase n=1 Tax=Nonomuraea guangzhouensis TaxID=1291555 RepID=A0ABW4GGQ5_9ACTN|nr:pyrroline-5-carboxylate reductase [Nonomuraea guangzhouensis]
MTKQMARHRLALIGGGNMGSALVGGLLAAGWKPADIAVVERLPGRAAQLGGLFPGVTVSGEMVRADGVVIAVKPYDVAAAANLVAAAGATRVLSIAAGISLATLSTGFGDGVAVVRGMPNTAALVGKGAAAIAAGPSSTEADLVWAEEILGAVGTVTRVTEAQLDAVTVLSGSGPAYLSLVTEALIDAGVLAGLPRGVSEAMVGQVFIGYAALFVESGRDPVALRAEVTSPGGVTAAALRVLEGHGLRSAFLEAVMAGTERSRELGQTGVEVRGA